MTEISGQIESIAFLGSGIMRHNGQVIFVPFTAPLDDVTATITNIKKNFLKAKILKINKESPQRQKPLCPHFTKCGGCQLQHIKYEEQLKIKTNFLKDSLTKIAKINNIKISPIFASKKIYFYRRHIKLHIYKDLIGFKDLENNQVINIEHCPIFSENKNIISDLRKLNIKSKEILVHKTNIADKYLFITDLKLKKLLSFNLDDILLYYSPSSFIQANEYVSNRIYLDIKNYCLNLNHKKILDLYCGIGATSLLLGKNGFKILGIEINPIAIKLAKKNQEINNIKDVNFILSDVDKIIDKILNDFNPDILLVNPPRIGLSQKLKSSIFKNKPKHIIYISCMPPTLARDLMDLTKMGYKIIQINPYDMFPQTTHLETVVFLEEEKITL